MLCWNLYYFFFFELHWRLLPDLLHTEQGSPDCGDSQRVAGTGIFWRCSEDFTRTLGTVGPLPFHGLRLLLTKDIQECKNLTFWAFLRQALNRFYIILPLWYWSRKTAGYFGGCPKTSFVDDSLKPSEEWLAAIFLVVRVSSQQRTVYWAKFRRAKGKSPVGLVQ